METLISENLKKNSTMKWVVIRHLSTILKYLTIPKLVNALLCFYEMTFKKFYLHSHPFYIRIEICPYCNLNCPGCLLGKKNNEETNPLHRKAGNMSFKLFKEVISCFLPWLLKVNLYDEGEPLLNKDVYQMIKFLNHNKIASCVSSNFSFEIDDKELLMLIDSKPEHLIIPIDGATQETYSTYRKGGNLNLVISNLKRLLSFMDKKQSKLKIDIQFLDFDDNNDELLKVYQIANELKVWRFTVLKGVSRKGYSGMRFQGTEAERRQKGCYEAWTTATINSMGELGVCDYGEDHGIENIGFGKDYLKKNFRNHPLLQNIRQSFKISSIPLHPVCRHCSLCKF